MQVIVTLKLLPVSYTHLDVYKRQEFIDHDLDIDFDAEMSRIQKEMRDILAQEKKSQKMLENAFRGIGYGID